MKTFLLFPILLISVISTAQSLSKEEKIQKKIDNVIEEYKYPVDKRTGKIKYSKTISMPELDKKKIMKRALGFISVQNYTRTENITCKNKTNIITQIFDKDILYKDEDDGVISGNGYVSLEYHLRKRMSLVLLFNWKISIRDTAYKYEITDFRVVEFLSAPKNKSKGYSSGTYTGGAMFGSGGSTTTFSAAKVLNLPLEEVILKGYWQQDDTGDETFKEAIKKLYGDLKETMKGTF